MLEWSKAKDMENYAQGPPAAGDGESQPLLHSSKKGAVEWYVKGHAACMCSHMSHCRWERPKEHESRQLWLGMMMWA